MSLGTEVGLSPGDIVMVTVRCTSVRWRVPLPAYYIVTCDYATRLALCLHSSFPVPVMLLLSSFPQRVPIILCSSPLSHLHCRLLSRP